MTILTFLHLHVFSFNKVRFFPLVLLFFFFNSISISFSQVVPNNEKYLQEKILNESINIIYSPYYRDIIPEIKEKLSSLTKLFEKERFTKQFCISAQSHHLLKGVHQTLPTSVFLISAFYFLHLQLTAQIGKVMRAKAKVRARKNSTFHVFSLTILGKDSPARHHCARRKPSF